MSTSIVGLFLLGWLLSGNLGLAQIPPQPEVGPECPQTDLACFPEWLLAGRGVARVNNYVKGVYATAFLVAYFPKIDSVGRCGETKYVFVPMALTNAHVFDCDDDGKLDLRDLASVRATYFEFNFTAPECGKPGPVETQKVTGYKILTYRYSKWGDPEDDFALVELNQEMFNRQIKTIAPFFFGLNTNPQFCPKPQLIFTTQGDY